MSLWAKVLGAREQADLPEALALDLLRLKRVRRVLGQANWPLKLKYSDAREQLHQVSRDLGERLARCSAGERMAVASAFARADDVLPAEVKAGGRAAEMSEIKSVLEKGCGDLGRSLSDAQLEAIHSHLHSKPVLLSNDAHSAKEQVASLADVPVNRNYACYDYLDLWSSPHVLELAAQEKIIDLAQGYLGCTPTLFSINAFWSLPNRQPHKASQVFHRDWEDYRSLVVFTMLTPVDDPDEGAHYYVETSHEVNRFEAALKADGVTDADVDNLVKRDEEIIAPTALRLFEHTARRFDGPAGQSFCGDGYGLHRALVPRSRPRLLLWFRFGNFFNETAYRIVLPDAPRATARQALERIPSTPRHQYVFRYLIEALSAV